MPLPLKVAVFLLVSILGLGSLPGWADEADEAAADTTTAMGDADKSVTAGNVLLVLDGGIDFPSSRLLDAEKDLNLIRGGVVYNDGSVQNPQVEHMGYRWGITAEYLVYDDFGVQAGFALRSLQQTVGTGGDGYETHKFAEGTLLSYGNPYLGAVYYLINSTEGNLFAAARGGVITGGQIYPLVTSNEYFGLPIRSYGLSGYNASVGLGVSWVYTWLVAEFSVYGTENFFRTSGQAYPELDQSFTLTSLDLNLSLGVRF